MNPVRRLLRYCLLLLLCGGSWLAFAQVPNLLAHQGHLTGSNGTPVSASVSMRFALYANASGGSPLWQETQTVAVQGGAYAVNLGSVTPLTLPFAAPYYLGISVGSDAEMTPRLQLTSTAYARTAQVALSVADGSITAAKLGQTCASGQVLAYNGSAWACATVGGGGNTDANGNLNSGGYVKLGGASSVCDSNAAGALRWTGSRFEGCDGTGWTPFAVAGCSDGVKNGSESDIDCGGACGQKCSAGKSCQASSDCGSNICWNGACTAATANDSVKNGAETDVDCGGGSAPGCSIGKSCSVNGDCASATCLSGVCRPSGSCNVAADCPGSDSACSTRTCTAGMCGTSFAAFGTAVQAQTYGDCQQNVCNGSGGIQAVADNSDIPNGGSCP